MTHALRQNANATLKGRWCQHKGNLDGRGNHRTSIFRKLVDLAYRNKSEKHEQYPDWGIGNNCQASLVKSMNQSIKK